MVYFFKGSYSAGLNSFLSDNHKFSLLITRGVSGCFLGGGIGVCFPPGLSRIFVGHAPLSPTTVWVSVSLAHVFWVRASRDAGQSLPLWFSVMHSLTRHSRQLSLHPHILSFFPPFLSFFFLRGQHTAEPLVATNKVTCFSRCISKIMIKMYILKVAVFF